MGRVTQSYGVITLANQGLLDRVAFELKLGPNLLHGVQQGGGRSPSVKNRGLVLWRPDMKSFLLLYFLFL